MCAGDFGTSDRNSRLLASASVYGLVFVGCATAEMKVIKLTDIVNGTNPLPARTVPLAARPLAIALSCDSSMLAVYFVQNDMPLITIFQVESFLAIVIFFPTHFLQVY